MDQVEVNQLEVGVSSELQQYFQTARVFLLLLASGQVNRRDPAVVHQVGTGTL